MEDGEGFSRVRVEVDGGVGSGGISVAAFWVGIWSGFADWV